MSDKQVLTLVKSYHKRIRESDFAQNTKFKKFSQINILVKKYYPNLYEECRKFNVPDRQEKKESIEDRNKFMLQRIQNRQEFSYEEIMNAINTLKKSEDYYQLITCILLATGRRSTEVIARGNFEPSNLPHHILFSGQLKAGDKKREAYDIPVLGMTPANLIKLVAKARSLKNYDNETNEFIASRTNAYLNRTIAVDLDTPDRHTTSETIRCVYAYIAYRLYGNPRISEPAYSSKLLGHTGLPHVFVDNYQRVFISGIPNSEKEENEETVEDLRKQLAEKEAEIALLKREIVR